MACETVLRAVVRDYCGPMVGLTFRIEPAGVRDRLVRCNWRFGDPGIGHPKFIEAVPQTANIVTLSGYLLSRRSVSSASDAVAVANDRVNMPPHLTDGSDTRPNVSPGPAVPRCGPAE
jgi:hypothetical protein